MQQQKPALILCNFLFFFCGSNRLQISSNTKHAKKFFHSNSWLRKKKLTTWTQQNFQYFSPVKILKKKRKEFIRNSIDRIIVDFWMTSKPTDNFEFEVSRQIIASILRLLFFYITHIVVSHHRSEQNEITYSLAFHRSIL